MAWGIGVLVAYLEYQIVWSLMLLFNNIYYSRVPKLSAKLVQLCDFNEKKQQHENVLKQDVVEGAELNPLLSGRVLPLDHSFLLPPFGFIRPESNTIMSVFIRLCIGKLYECIMFIGCMKIYCCQSHCQEINTLHAYLFTGCM